MTLGKKKSKAFQLLLSPVNHLTSTGVKGWNKQTIASALQSLHTAHLSVLKSRKQFAPAQDTTTQALCWLAGTELVALY